MGGEEGDVCVEGGGGDVVERLDADRFNSAESDVAGGVLVVLFSDAMYINWSSLCFI